MCDIGTSCYLYVSSADHNAVHLLQGELRGFWDFILDKGETFVLLRHWIPRHVYGFDRAEGQKRLPDCVLFQFETYTPYINPGFGKTKLRFRTVVTFLRKYETFIQAFILVFLFLFFC